MLNLLVIAQLRQCAMSLFRVYLILGKFERTAMKTASGLIDTL